MANIQKVDLVDIELNTGNIHRSSYSHAIGMKDNNGDAFGVRVFRNGEAVDLTGVGVQGIFMPPQGSPIAITTGNSVSGNMAYVVLPQACYDYDGQFTLSIKLVGSGVTGTMRIVDGVVSNTYATGTVAPTETVPTYQEIIALYDDMIDATEAATEAIADAYSSSTAYAIGDYCIKDGTLYRCISAVSSGSTWDQSKWQETTFGDDLAAECSARTTADTEMQTLLGNAILQTTAPTVTGAINEHENDLSALKSAFNYRTDKNIVSLNMENASVSGNVGTVFSKTENVSRVSTTIVPIPAFKGMSISVNSTYAMTFMVVTDTGVIVSKGNSWLQTITLNETSNYVIFTFKKTNGNNITVTEAASAITNINFPINALVSDKSVSVPGMAADAYETRKIFESLLPKKLYKLLNVAPTSGGTGTSVSLVNSNQRVTTEKIPAFDGMSVTMKNGYLVSTVTVDSNGIQVATTTFDSGVTLSTSEEYSVYFVFKRPDTQVIIDAGELLACGLDSTNLPLDMIPDIIFWGDSLTQGAGGNGVNYPITVGQTLNKAVFNAGVGGETSNTIACRQGSDNIIIPVGAVNGTYNNGELKDVFGGIVSPLRQWRQFPGWNHIVINGQVCNLSITQTSSTSSDAVYTISGYTGGDIKFPTLGQFLGAKYEGKVTCVLVGTNGSTVGDETDINARITIIDSMIAKIGNEKYIIVGIPAGKLTTKQHEETAMLNHFGSKYLPTLETLIYHGLEICGLTPTAQDEEDIAAFYIPTSLRSDGTHLNSHGYNALGIIVSNKIEAMGYFDDTQ